MGKSPALSLREAKLEAAKYALENGVCNVTVNRLIEQYRKEVVDPTSKVPKQVYGYLKHIDTRFGRQKVIDIENSILSPSSGNTAQSAAPDQRIASGPI